MKKALITGITGQDGSYLAEFLLKKGYKVFGMKRRTSERTCYRISHILDDIEIVDGDLCDSGSLVKVVDHCKPDEVYNLAAQSFVKSSFDQAEYTGDCTGLGVTRLLTAIQHKAPHAKFYQASSSEMFGSSPPPQNESTVFHPRSPYGVAKLYAHYMTINFRERENGLFACAGILYNHDGPRRGTEFVTQKIAQGVASIKHGHSKVLKLGNLDATRDWGHARDYVRAMWMMMNHKTPDDYVVATGKAHSVRDFARVAFGHVGLDYEDYVEIDPKFFRPTEVDALLGDSTKIYKRLGWEPLVTFEDLVAEMVDHAMEHPEEWFHQTARARKQTARAGQAVRGKKR